MPAPAAGESPGALSGTPSAAFERSPGGVPGVGEERWESIENRLQQSRQFFGALLPTSPIKATMSTSSWPGPKNNRPLWPTDSAVPADHEWLTSSDTSSTAHRMVTLESEVSRLRGDLDERDDELAAVMQEYADRTRYLQGKLEAVAEQQRQQQRSENESRQTISQLSSRLRAHQARRGADESQREQQADQTLELGRALRDKLAEKDVELGQAAAAVDALQVVKLAVALPFCPQAATIIMRPQWRIKLTAAASTVGRASVLQRQAHWPERRSW